MERAQLLHTSLKFNNDEMTARQRHIILELYCSQAI